jgi:hypothetical protein
MMMMADLQTSATVTTKMARADFIVMSSRNMKTMVEGQIYRGRLLFLVEKEKDLLKKLLKS